MAMLPTGKSFKCECGCNVFHRPEENPDKFECNACGIWYVGEKATATKMQEGK